MHRTTALRPTLALLALASAALPVAADELVHEVEASLSIDSPGGSATMPMALPAFPPELGQLQTVLVEADLSTRGWYGCENTLRQGVYALVELSSDLVVFHQGGAPLLSTNLYTADAEILSAFDGAVDFAGTSGLQNAFAHSWTDAEDPVVDGWTAGDQGASIPLELVLASQLWTNPGALESALEQTLSFRLRVRYTYQPTFEPYGKGKATSLGSVPKLAGGAPPQADQPGTVLLSGAVQAEIAWLLVGTERVELPFQGGALYVGGVVEARFVGPIGPLGAMELELPAGEPGAGGSRCVQVFFRDALHPDGTHAGLSSALEVLDPGAQ